MIACKMTMGSKHTSFAKWKSQTLLKVCPRKPKLARSVLRKKIHPRRYSCCNKPLQRCGDRVIIWSFAKFDCLYDYYGVKAHFVPQIEESHPAQSVLLEASTRKECFERKKIHPQRYSFCNTPSQTTRDRVITWSFGNLNACTMTMGSKHTSFPKLKNLTSPKVCPWKCQLARSELRGKNSIRGGTHFAIIPLQRPEIV